MPGVLLEAPARIDVVEVLGLDDEQPAASSAALVNVEPQRSQHERAMTLPLIENNVIISGTRPVCNSMGNDVLRIR